MDTEQIIQKNCGNIKERLLACRTKSVAYALKDRLCSELQLNCESHMVNNVLNDHVDLLIDDIFDQDGKNKYLEARQDEAHNTFGNNDDRYSDGSDGMQRQQYTR